MWKVVKVDPELHKKLKEYADSQGQKMQWIAEQALSEYLKEYIERREREYVYSR